MLIKLRIWLLLLILACSLWPYRATRAAVVLEYFRASPDPDGIKLEWATTSETDNDWFYLLRSTRADGIYEQVAIIWSYTENGEGDVYDYIDSDETMTIGALYYYKLESIDLYGQWEFFGPVSAPFGVSAWTATPTSTSTRKPLTSPTVTSTGSGFATTTPTFSGSLTQTATPTATWTGTEESYPYPVDTVISQDLNLLTSTPTSTPEAGVTATIELGLATSTGTLDTTQQFIEESTAAPTVDLLFPAKPTSSVLPTSSAVIAQPAALEITQRPESFDSGRTYALLSIPIVLWIALAVFLVLFVRRIFVGAVDDLTES